MLETITELLMSDVIQMVIDKEYVIKRFLNRGKIVNDII